MKKLVYLFSKVAFLLIFASTQLVSQADESYSINLLDDWEINGSLLHAADDDSSILAIFVSGSGPTDRNGNNSHMVNNSLKYLADGLVTNGISSYRYDKRGIAESVGSGFDETNILFSTFVEDLTQITQHFVDKKKYKKIIIAGHSEGALIGLLVAKQIKSVDGYISIAGAGRDAKTLIIEQLNNQMPLLAEEALVVFDSLEAGHEVKKINPFLLSIFRPSIQPYIMEWTALDPAKELSEYQKPSLILQGKHDIQVTEVDGERLKAFQTNANYIAIDSMNHVLKNCKQDLTSNLATYNDPDLAINKKLLSSIIDFIKSI